MLTKMQGNVDRFMTFVPYSRAVLFVRPVSPRSCKTSRNSSGSFSTNHRELWRSILFL